MIHLVDPSHFRVSILLCTLGERPLTISGLHSDSGGMTSYESLFLDLLSLISNGTTM